MTVQKHLMFQRLVLTPWNSLIYNMNPANLAHHGMHPLWLHILVNMPLLFGPACVYLLPSVRGQLKLQNGSLYRSNGSNQYGLD